MKLRGLFLISWLFGVLAGIELRAEEKATLAERLGGLGRSAREALGKDGGNRFFYMPTGPVDRTPATYNFPYEEVFFPGMDGARLHG
ncbi:MAG: hypothetical protein ACQKBY_02200, partial [Verrucomicrobiales bacterium]